jgi:hypothetical protein
MAFKMTHFVFHVKQKHFITYHENKMCHFECHRLNFKSNNIYTHIF